MSNIQYGNDEKLDESQVLEYLKKLETFKDEKSYDLKKSVSNKTLSSGQMQKIAFIRALLTNIELLILDESTANLDKESTLKIFDLLREKDVTIINSTHDPKKFFDVDEEIRIVIQDEKRIIEIHKLKR